MSPLNVFRTVEQFREWRRELLVQGHSLGLVPTMGALHAGHISLVEHARMENDAVAISIFVNPAQFAPHEDFDAYPRTWAADRKIIESLDLNIVAVFIPTKQEMYPRDISLNVKEQKGSFVEVLGLSEQAHLAQYHIAKLLGVATVVTKLFNIVQPERAYFGQKDVQQTVVIKAMIQDLHIPLELRVCPTVREPDGLALSSRNAYLESSQRNYALLLWHSLKAGLELYRRQPLASATTILKVAQDTMTQGIHGSNGRVSVDYLKIVHPETLDPLSGADLAKSGILVGAIFLQGNERTIRLIDNVFLE